MQKTFQTERPIAGSQGTNGNKAYTLSEAYALLQQARGAGGAEKMPVRQPVLAEGRAGQ